jgi:hypothetical protein
MLYRHNWRKVKPDTRHPKSDSISQEEFKKNWVFADFGSFRPIPKNANHRCNMLINIKNQIYLGNFGGVELNKVESREEIKAILNRLKSNKIS